MSKLSEEEKEILEYRYPKAIDIIYDLKEQIRLKNKQIDLMAEQLTTPTHNKEWVKKYYENEVNTNE